MGEIRNRSMDLERNHKNIIEIEKLIKNSIVTSQVQVVKTVRCNNLLMTALGNLDVIKRVQPEDVNLRKKYVWNDAVKADKVLTKQILDWIVDYNNRREKRHLKLTGKSRKRIKGIAAPKKEWILEELPTVVVRIIKGLNETDLNKKSDEDLLTLISSYIKKEIID